MDNLKSLTIKHLDLINIKLNKNIKNLFEGELKGIYDDNDKLQYIACSKRIFSLKTKKFLKENSKNTNLYLPKCISILTEKLMNFLFGDLIKNKISIPISSNLNENTKSNTFSFTESLETGLKNKIDIKKIIKIQSICRRFIEKKKYRILVCKYIIKLIGKNDRLMKECYIKILKVLYTFPPAKNEYKFIYGKLIEKILINTMNKIIKCDDLDKNYKCGSEYKFDMNMLIKFSSKAVANNKSNIIILNKLNKQVHSIYNVNFMICYVKSGELYIFPSFFIPKEFVNNSGSNISYISKIYTYLKQSSFKYVFPKLSNKENETIKNIKCIDVYEYLYNNFIR